MTRRKLFVTVTVLLGLGTLVLWCTSEPEEPGWHHMGSELYPIDAEWALQFRRPYDEEPGIRLGEAILQGLQVRRPDAEMSKVDKRWERSVAPIASGRARLRERPPFVMAGPYLAVVLSHEGGYALALLDRHTGASAATMPLPGGLRPGDSHDSSLLDLSPTISVFGDSILVAYPIVPPLVHPGERGVKWPVMLVVASMDLREDGELTLTKTLSAHRTIPISHSWGASLTDCHIILSADSDVTGQNYHVVPRGLPGCHDEFPEPDGAAHNPRHKPRRLIILTPDDGKHDGELLVLLRKGPTWSANDAVWHFRPGVSRRVWPPETGSDAPTRTTSWPRGASALTYEHTPCMSVVGDFAITLSSFNSCFGNRFLESWCEWLEHWGLCFKMLIIFDLQRGEVVTERLSRCGAQGMDYSCHPVTMASPVTFHRVGDALVELENDHLTFTPDYRPSRRFRRSLRATFGPHTDDPKTVVLGDFPDGHPPRNQTMIPDQVGPSGRLTIIPWSRGGSVFSIGSSPEETPPPLPLKTIFGDNAALVYAIYPGPDVLWTRGERGIYRWKLNFAPASGSR